MGPGSGLDAEYLLHSQNASYLAGSRPTPYRSRLRDIVTVGEVTVLLALGLQIRVSAAAATGSDRGQGVLVGTVMLAAGLISLLLGLTGMRFRVKRTRDGQVVPGYVVRVFIRRTPYTPLVHFLQVRYAYQAHIGTQVRERTARQMVVRCGRPRPPVPGARVAVLLEGRTNSELL